MCRYRARAPAVAGGKACLVRWQVPGSVKSATLLQTPEPSEGTAERRCPAQTLKAEQHLGGDVCRSGCLEASGPHGMA